MDSSGRWEKRADLARTGSCCRHRFAMAATYPAMEKLAPGEKDLAVEAAKDLELAPADGITPALVTRVNKTVLELSNTLDFGPELFRRMERLYARVLPGLGVKGERRSGSRLFCDRA